MKRFIIQTILVVSPIIIGLSVMEYCLRSIPNDYSYKRNFFEHNSEKIEYLILGSSHSYYGIDPTYIDGFAFNASHISQSIDYDYEIFKRYNGQFKKLKTIIIPIDYFTLFSRVSTGVESWRVKNYEIYYGINKSYNIKDHFELLNFKFSKNLTRCLSYLKNRKKNSITCSELGYGNLLKKQKDLNETGISAAKRHTKNDQKFYSKNLQILEDFVKHSNEKGVNIIFITFPAYHTYTENLNKHQLNKTMATIKDIVNRNPQNLYFNFLYDQDFDATHFQDADHLNKKGAQLLSEKINLILNN